MTEHPLFPGLQIVCRCVCGHAFLGYYAPGELSPGYSPMHVPEDFDCALGKKPAPYCFVWSTLSFLWGIYNGLRSLIFEHVKRPVVRLLKNKDFKYTCHYCGRKTRQAPLRRPSGGMYPAYCSAPPCIKKFCDEPVEKDASS